jgi:CRP/FNR family transcriptional regulator, cyclic AMP receptor protein
VHPALEQALAASFWKKLPREPVEALFAEGKLAEVPAGLLISEDQARGQVALVLSGLFRLFARAKTGRQVTVSYAREGDMIGVTSALAGPCPMGMQSLSVGSLWVLSADALKRHALADARLAWAVAEDSARSNFDILGELADTTFGTVRQRVARHLLDLVVESPDNGLLVAPISQQELANAVGTAREVVSRVLGVLRSEGLVRATQAGLEVLDATQLYEQSQITD